jgi:hypothetical protein
MWSREMVCLLLASAVRPHKPRGLVLTRDRLTTNSPPVLTSSVSSFSRSALNVNCTWGTSQGVLRRSLSSRILLRVICSEPPRGHLKLASSVVCNDVRGRKFEESKVLDPGFWMDLRLQEHFSSSQIRIDLLK